MRVIRQQERVVGTSRLTVEHVRVGVDRYCDKEVDLIGIKKTGKHCDAAEIVICKTSARFLRDELTRFLRSAR